MRKQEIINAIDKDIKALKKAMPNYPDHIVAQAALLNADAGKLTTLCINKKYKGFTNEDTEIKATAIRIIAQALRFIDNLKI